MTINKRIVDVAQSVLRDLYGLIPKEDRKTADDYVFVLKQALSAYSDILNHMQQIDSALYHSGRYIEQKLTEIERVEG